MHFAAASIGLIIRDPHESHTHRTSSVSRYGTYDEFPLVEVHEDVDKCTVCKHQMDRSACHAVCSDPRSVPALARARD